LCTLTILFNIITAVLSQIDEIKEKNEKKKTQDSRDKMLKLRKDKNKTLLEYFGATNLEHI